MRILITLIFVHWNGFNISLLLLHSATMLIVECLCVCKWVSNNKCACMHWAETRDREREIGTNSNRYISLPHTHAHSSLNHIVVMRYNFLIFMDFDYLCRRFSILLDCTWWYLYIYIQCLHDSTLWNVHGMSIIIISIGASNMVYHKYMQCGPIAVWSTSKYNVLLFYCCIVYIYKH